MQQKGFGAIERATAEGARRAAAHGVAVASRLRRSFQARPDARESFYGSPINRCQENQT
jgi:hypothetical protein